MNNATAVPKMVDALFESMQAIFPAFRQAWPNQETFNRTKSEWVDAFLDSNFFSQEKINKGLRIYRLLPEPFVPSVGQFIAMCKPTAKDIGAPSVEKAFHEATCNSNSYGEEVRWSHEAVQIARQRTGSFNLRTRAEREIFPIFKHHYENVIEEMLDEEELKDRTINISHDAIRLPGANDE